jgi:outer membrane immunogenic protein
MRRFVVGGLLAAVLVSAAGAADLPVKVPGYTAPPPVQAFSWTGCYIGGNVGGIINSSELAAYPSGAYSAAIVALGTYNYNAKDSAFSGGVQYGCNRQYGQFVLGLDSDFDWAGLNETINASHPANPGIVAYSETITQKLNWYSTTRARLGWAQDRWMFFIDGGLASGRVKSTYFSPPAGGFAYGGSQSKTRYGWAVGGGVEYALSENWFLRGEYLYVDLGKYSYTDLQTPASGAGFTWGTDVDTRFHVARVALSYRFTRAGSLLEWAMGGFR